MERIRRGLWYRGARGYDIRDMPEQELKLCIKRLLEYDRTEYGRKWVARIRQELKRRKEGKRK